MTLKNDGDSYGVILIFSRKSHYPIETIETVYRSENNDLIQVSFNGHRLLSTVHLIKGEYISWQR